TDTTPTPSDTATTPGKSATPGTVTVTGTLRCPDHPGGCDVWITLVNARGKRRAASRATNGRYRLTALPPGSYTLIASGSTHPPRAEFLSVRQGPGELRHDIELERVGRG
ncbi:carboxypeptidase-like regulatory domain-containing protein, partial [Streptomyces pinistramenti]|uniref:carboxypeptidase-like regulatory domain-containing protein n=1 Tax=Streptomyces pinistramenti TaxID=2884812 RepID=UPI001D08465B